MTHGGEWGSNDRKVVFFERVGDVVAGFLGEGA